VTRLICVLGSAPGIGKSTLCERLRASFERQRLGVDHFAEEDILTAPEFAEVAGEFRSTGVVAMATLLAATKAYVKRVERFDVAIADSQLPYLPSLIAFGHSREELVSFLADLAEIVRPVDPVVVYLDGDPASALRRAAEREGDGWLDWFVAKLARYRVSPPVHDVRSASAYLAGERETILALLRDWPVLVVDAAGPGDLVERVLLRLGRMAG
jgi:thymidylate kinase